MGEGKKDALRVNFDRKLKLKFHGVKVASDAGLLAYRKIMFYECLNGEMSDKNT